MSRKQGALPERCPEGTRYSIESRGAFAGGMWVQRYVIYPDGRRLDLGIRAVAFDDANKPDNPSIEDSPTDVRCERA
jgi:hypothetical protein